MERRRKGVRKEGEGERVKGRDRGMAVRIKGREERVDSYSALRTIGEKGKLKSAVEFIHLQRLQEVLWY